MREILGEVLGEVLERHVIVFITILGQPSGAGGILEYICCDAWLGIKALCFQALEISIEQALEGRCITCSECFKAMFCNCVCVAVLRIAKVRTKSCGKKSQQKIKLYDPVKI